LAAVSRLRRAGSIDYFGGRRARLCRFGWHDRFSGLHPAGESVQKIGRAFARNSAWTASAGKVLYEAEGGRVSVEGFAVSEAGRRSA